jgi:glycosyltransferase involved in cell wall biosynthesis
LVGNIIDKIVYKKIINFINEQDLQPYIKIMGFVDRKDLLTLYDNCIALSYLSVSGPENLPPLEAFARGKPVLYSNFKGAKEQLKNYPLYINYKNPLDIAKGMKIILSKKKFSKVYIKFARSKDTIKYISKVNSVLEKLK